MSVLVTLWRGWGRRGMTLRRRVARLSVAVMLLVPLPSQAEEGLFTFDNFPSAAVREKFGSAPDQAWLDRVRLGAVRLDAGSASLVSADGLVLTAHHVVRDCVE